MISNFKLLCTILQQEKLKHQGKCTDAWNEGGNKGERKGRSEERKKENKEIHD